MNTDPLADVLSRLLTEDDKTSIDNAVITYLREIDADEQAALDAEAALDERYDVADRGAECAPGEKPIWRT